MDHSMSDMDQARAIPFDNAPAEMNRSWIDTEHEHALEPIRATALGEARSTVPWDIP